MVYIEIENLNELIRHDMLMQSVENDADKLDVIEATAIDEVKAYISSVYKVDLIFATTPIKNGLLIRIISMLVVYRAVRRNAARKVPVDYDDFEDQAYSLLANIANGKLTLTNCPLVTNEDGSAKLLYGNSRKSENYI